MQMRKLALALLLAGMASNVAQAEEAATQPAAKAEVSSDTLKKIKDSGVIVVGHRESSVPFSYYDNQQKVVGYSQDYSNVIVEAVKKKLKCARPASQTDPDYLAKPYSIAAKRHV